MIGGDPGGGSPECCPGSYSTFIAVLAGGYPNIPLYWNGTSWTGGATLSCGETLYLRYLTNCTMDYSCNGFDWRPTPAGLGPAPACAPFSDVRGYLCDMDDAAGGCAPGLCGTISIIEVRQP